MLAKSQLLRSFLDPNSIEFSSSIFNEITNLGKIVKGVPYKLRVEVSTYTSKCVIRLKSAHIRSEQQFI